MAISLELTPECTGARLFALPTEVKERYPLDPAKNIGWESQSQVRPSTGFPDVKESMCVFTITYISALVAHQISNM